MKQVTESKPNYERSRVSISFGDPFEKSTMSLDINLHTNDVKSQEQTDMLKNLVGTNIDIENSFVFQFQSNDPDRLKDTINNLLKSTEVKYLTKVQSVLTIKVFSDKTSVYISIRGNPLKESEFTGFLQVLLDAGLSNITKEQDNNIEFSLELNYDMIAVQKQLLTGERIGSILMKNMKFEMDLNLHQDLAEKLKGLVESIDPEYLDSPPMMMVSYFKNYDIDLAFNSTADLPDAIKNKIMLGEWFSECPEDKQKFRVDKYPLLKEFLDAVGTQASLYLTIPGLAALQIDFVAPTLGDFIQNYGRAMILFMFGTGGDFEDLPTDY